MTPPEDARDRTVLDPRADVQCAAQRIRDALTRLGYCYETKSGSLVEVSYRQLSVVGDRYGLLEIDVQRLPPRVRLDKLSNRETLHHLTAVVGRPVRMLNTTGLTYCVELRPRPTRRLPHRVPLDLDARPEGPYMIPIGYGAEGPVWRSLLETSHLLVGGESRSGKSTWLNAALVALLAAHDPAALRLALVDPKGVEFTAYDGLPHLVRPVAVTPAAATAVTGWLIAEMDRRRRAFAGVLARSLDAYNERARRTGSDALPLILVVIDEVTDIALQCGLRSAFYKNLIRLASKGAAFGLILVLATQNPKAEVLSTLIRGNLSTRIAFRVSTAEHARTILGCGGAQDLPRTVRGRMLARLDEGTTLLQGYYVADETIHSLTRRWVRRGAPALSALERDLVRYSLDALAGDFTIAKLYGAFRGRISRRQLLKLGRQWEAAGYLTAPPSPTAPRRVTDTLHALHGDRPAQPEDDAI